MSRNTLRNTMSAEHYVTVVTADDTDFADGIADGLYVGTSGHISVIRPDGTNVTFSNVPVGELMVRCRGVNATGTTAGDLIALYV